MSFFVMSLRLILNVHRVCIFVNVCVCVSMCNFVCVCLSVVYACVCVEILNHLNV